jgi:hypothetical protein
MEISKLMLMMRYSIDCTKSPFGLRSLFVGSISVLRQISLNWRDSFTDFRGIGKLYRRTEISFASRKQRLAKLAKIFGANLFAKRESDAFPSH